MHLFDPARPRTQTGQPMYVRASGQGIAPCWGLELRPKEPGPVEPIQRWDCGAWWLYEPNVARWYGVENVSLSVVTDFMREFVEGPEEAMGKVGWTWRDVKPGGGGGAKVTVSLGDLGL